MKKKNARILIFGIIAAMIIVMLLMGFGLIHPLVFWVVIILGAVFAFKVLPNWKLT